MWDLPGPGTEPVSPDWQADPYQVYHQGSPLLFLISCWNEIFIFYYFILFYFFGMRFLDSGCDFWLPDSPHLSLRSRDTRH